MQHSSKRIYGVHFMWLLLFGGNSDIILLMVGCYCWFWILVFLWICFQNILFDADLGRGNGGLLLDRDVKMGGSCSNGKSCCSRVTLI